MRLGGKSCTSKLGTLDDLQALRTLGFRGEALYGCCTAGTTSVHSRGCMMEYDEYGRPRFDTPQPSAQETGTLVCVANLFARMPVRRQMIEEETEKTAKAITQLISVYALGNPAIEFRVTYSPDYQGNDFVSRAQASLQERVSDLFGPRLTKELVEVHFVESERTWRINGLLPAPDLHTYTESVRSKGVRTFLFLNRRPVNIRSISKLVNRVFREHTGLKAKFPFIFLDMVLPPDEFDVNVPNDKKDVKLEFEEDILEWLKDQLLDMYPSKGREMSSQASSTSTPRSAPVYRDEWDAGSPMSVGVGGAIVFDDSSVATPQPTNTPRSQHTQQQSGHSPEEQPRPPPQFPQVSPGVVLPDNHRAPYQPQFPPLRFEPSVVPRDVEPLSVASVPPPHPQAAQSRAAPDIPVLVPSFSSSIGSSSSSSSASSQQSQADAQPANVFAALMANAAKQTTPSKQKQATQAPRQPSSSTQQQQQGGVVASARVSRPKTRKDDDDDDDDLMALLHEHDNVAPPSSKRATPATAPKRPVLVSDAADMAVDFDAAPARASSPVKRQKSTGCQFVDDAPALPNNEMDFAPGNIAMIRTSLLAGDVFYARCQARPLSSPSRSSSPSSAAQIPSVGQLLGARYVGFLGGNDTNGTFYFCCDCCSTLFSCHGVTAAEMLIEASLRDDASPFPQMACDPQLFFTEADIGSIPQWDLMRGDMNCAEAFRRNGFIVDPRYFDTRVQREVIRVTHAPNCIAPEQVRETFLELLKQCLASKLAGVAVETVRPKAVLAALRQRARQMAVKEPVGTPDKATNLLRQIAMSTLFSEQDKRKVFSKLWIKPKQ